MSASIYLFLLILIIIVFIIVGILFILYSSQNQINSKSSPAQDQINQYIQENQNFGGWTSVGVVQPSDPKYQYNIYTFDGSMQSGLYLPIAPTLNSTDLDSKKGVTAPQPYSNVCSYPEQIIAKKLRLGCRPTQNTVNKAATCSYNGVSYNLNEEIDIYVEGSTEKLFPPCATTDGKNSSVIALNVNNVNSNACLEYRSTGVFANNCDLSKANQIWEVSKFGFDGKPSDTGLLAKIALRSNVVGLIDPSLSKNDTSLCLTPLSEPPSFNGSRTSSKISVVAKGCSGLHNGGINWLISPQESIKLKVSDKDVETFLIPQQISYIPKNFVPTGDITTITNIIGCTANCAYDIQSIGVDLHWAPNTNDGPTPALSIDPGNTPIILETFFIPDNTYNNPRAFDINVNSQRAQDVNTILYNLISQYPNRYSF